MSEYKKNMYILRELRCSGAILDSLRVSQPRPRHASLNMYKNILLTMSMAIFLVTCGMSSYATDHEPQNNKAEKKSTNKQDESKSTWIKNALSSLKDGLYPRVKAISWWHENFDDSRLRIDSTKASLTSYQQNIASSIFMTSANFSGNKLSAPVSGIYHAAYPDFGGTEDIVTAQRISDFEKLAKKDIAWAYFSNNWYDNIQFPNDAVTIIHNSGKVPFIRMMPRSNFDEGGPDPEYTMQRIIDGKFDKNLKQWAIDAKSTGIPLLVEFGTEVNGNWFPWNGQYNGGSKKGGYGDPAKADGPERFVDAYRHIINIFRDNNVDNITWFFHADAYSMPEKPWNDIKNYYPGDEYIDWIGLSVYGPQLPGEEFQSFTEIMNDAYPVISAISNKPIAILEFAINDTGYDVTNGIKVAFGQQFSIKSSEVKLTSGEPFSEFIDTPKINAVFNHPIKGTGKNVKIKVLTDLPATDNSSVTEITCEWKRNVLLYDKHALKAANKEGISTTSWLTNNPISTLVCLLKIQLYLPDWTQVSGNINKQLLLIAPEITSLNRIDGTIIENSSVELGSIIVVNGKYFGYKRPKVWLESQENHGKVKRQQLKVKRFFQYKDPRGRDGKSCMNLLNGDSLVQVLLPNKWRNGWTSGTYNLVIDNKLGLSTTPISITTKTDQTNYILK